MSCGSELQHAIEAAKSLGPSTRVVSMPSFKRFEAQPLSYRQSVLPPSIRKRVAIEAAVGQSWHKYVGLDGAVLSIERFGLSGPGKEVMNILGMTAAKVVEAAKAL